MSKQFYVAEVDSFDKLEVGKNFSGYSLDGQMSESSFFLNRGPILSVSRLEGKVSRVETSDAVYFVIQK